jgi:MoaA/NifB/PqqE/SkfB family radical SAM enzyme
VYSLVLKLIKNGLRYRYLRLVGKPSRPQALTLEITHNCLAKCVMCNIWKIPRDVLDMPVETWIRLLSSDLFSQLIELDITGGEPFMREDISDLIHGICDLKKSRLPNLRSIAITTNGILTKKILEFIEQSSTRLLEAQIDLVIVCAVDAIGSIHDQVRNVKGAWTKVNETINRLAELREKYPNLIIGLKTTILPLNINELESISQYAEKYGLFKIISPFIITKGRYLNEEKTDDLIFTESDYRKMIQFFLREKGSWDYHGNALVSYCRTGIMEKPCSCGFNYFFIRSTGEIFLCPLIDKSLGNINDANIEELYNSNQASRMRKSIGRFPQCRTCTEPGLERYSLPFEGFSYLKLLKQMGKSSFLKFHQHMGFDKYLG